MPCVGAFGQRPIPPALLSRHRGFRDGALNVAAGGRVMFPVVAAASEVAPRAAKGTIPRISTNQEAWGLTPSTAVITESKGLVGKGIYSIGEAVRLTGVDAPSVNRWMRGYHFQHGGEARLSPAIWRHDLDPIRGRTVLTFLDMMEIRFIRSFRKHHVSWAAIREAADTARALFEDGHPFTRGRFKTDGKRIFRQIEESGRIKLFDMNRGQWAFNEIVEPSLFRDVELADDQVARWYPDYPRRQIVIDPAICFGRPILAAAGIPTDTLAAAVAAEKSAQFVAKLYHLSADHVRAAVEFEERLAA